MTKDILKKLNIRDELLLYFPYSGKTVYAELVEHITHWNSGLRVQYIHDNRVKIDDLYYDNLKNDPTSHKNWIAYECVK